MGAAAPTRGRDGAPGLPASWIAVARGPAGGAVWSGNIPNTFVRTAKASAVYLPPGFTLARRYPVLYLLHGLPGSPSSYYTGLHLADVADGLISSGKVQPFIIVLPVGAHSETAEWAGAWEDFVVHDVVPWTDAHLPTIASPRGRALGGLCAGGYGAMDIGLRNPDLFGTLESWQGYFAPVFRDGPFARAAPATLAANDPTLLVRKNVDELRRARIRFYVSAGGNHAQILRKWSLDFASLLGELHLEHTLWLLPADQRGHFWSATLPSALQYAGDGFAPAA